MARKEYSKCARLIEEQIKRQGLTEDLSERIIGVGIALEWLRRAAEMETITFIGKNLDHSEHKERFTDFIRYGFVWFGLNAVYSRRALLSIVGSAHNNNEFERFKVLYNAHLITDATKIETELKTLLDTRIITRLPNRPSQTSTTTLKAIHTKYIPKGPIKGTTAKKLEAAAHAESSAMLDLPTMLYGFRNWSVHGNAMDGCFGSHQRYMDYVNLLTSVLAEVHLNTARTIATRL